MFLLTAADHAEWILDRRCRYVLLFAIVLATVVTSNSLVEAQTYAVLNNFGSVVRGGADPGGTLIQDAAGNLYGTTQGGGRHGAGIVFRLTTLGVETVIYDFNRRPDAMFPLFGLLRDAAGNFYGTSEQGGTRGPKNGVGTVYKLNAAGKETILHNFGSGTDGSYPACVLIQDAKGNLYGTTSGGGKYGDGTVFKIATTGQETVLHDFTGIDGDDPVTGLAEDSQGNLFGTTAAGTVNGAGTVFELAADGKMTILHSFCSTPNCKDGRNPNAGLIQDKYGNLYATTLGGGANGLGTVFKLTKEGKESVLHSFGTGQDGKFPWSGLTRDTDGNLYGTTFTGGVYGRGTVFELNRTGKETVLHSFCAQTNCVDGNQPAFASLLLARDGNLYGVVGGGLYQLGVVFRIALPSR